MTDSVWERLLQDAVCRYAVQDAESFMADVSPADPSPDYLTWERKFLTDPFGCAKKKSRWRSVLRAAAGFTLVAGLSLGAVLLVSPQARAVFSQIWTQVTEAFVRFSFSGESTETKNWPPTYLPEGFVEVSYEFDATTGRHSFENEEHNWLDIQYATLSGSFEFLVDNEHSISSTIRVNGSDAILMTSCAEGYPSYLVWNDTNKDTAFLVAGDVPWQELIKVAESLESSP